MSDLVGLIEGIRARHAPDRRSGVFEVQPEDRGEAIALVGVTTVALAADEVVAAAADLAGVPVLDEIVRLPDRGLASRAHALVRAALAPVYAEPGLPAPLISQLVMGVRVEVLFERGDWRLVRGEDAYIGWVHAGYLLTGDAEWAAGWERGTRGEPVVSLGAELADESGWVFARPPFGARLCKYGALYGTPDERKGTPVKGEIVDIDRRADRYPPRGDSIARTARGWIGSPYLWGGVTPAGVDCSGFVQAVLWMHGLALPRDSDQQAGVGEPIDAGDDFDNARAGDLLYFAEAGARVTHVALSLGGARIVHAALTNGGVAENDLLGDAPLERRLRATFVGGRRLLPG